MKRTTGGIFAMVAGLVTGYMAIWLITGSMGTAHAQFPTDQPFSCGLDNIAGTLTQCQPAPVSGQALYITSIVAQSTTTTGGQWILRYGTGSNCGTGTTSLLPSAATVVRLAHPANTSPPALLAFTQPLRVPPEKALCALGVATNTLTIQVSGFIR